MPRDRESRADAGQRASAFSDRGELKRRQFLDAAAEELASNGYWASTLADIANRAGSHAGSVYYYFDDRDELVVEVLVRGINELHASVREAVDALSPNATARQRLARAIQVNFEAVLDNNPYLMASQRNAGHLPDIVEQALRPAQRAFGRYLSQLFQHAVAAGDISPDVDISAVRLLVVGASAWAHNWYGPQGSSSASEIGDLLARMVLSGLAPEAGHATAASSVTVPHVGGTT